MVSAARLRLRFDLGANDDRGQRSMGDLINGLAGVKDGLTLIAFLSLVLLLAFRTKQVPELFFGLVRDKLTRAQFSALLNRFMTLGLIAFLALVALAVVSQVIGHRSQPGAGATAEDLRHELAGFKASLDQKLEAEAKYSLSAELLARHDIAGAIDALKASIAALPTLTAKETLANLYRANGDPADAAAARADAMKIATQRGDAIALVRLQNEAAAGGAVFDVAGEHDLIGASTPLPKGGDTFETAPPLSPGFYNCAVKEGCFAWYRMELRAGQRIDVKFRSATDGGFAGLVINGTNGEAEAQAGDSPGSMRGNSGPPNTLYRLGWLATVSGAYFLKTVADPGVVYRIRVV
jgi:hypothetical protein